MVLLLVCPDNVIIQMAIFFMTLSWWGGSFGIMKPV